MGIFVLAIAVIAGAIAFLPPRRGIIVVTVIVAMYLLFSSYSPVTINLTPSIPTGPYWKHHEPLRRGLIVTFAPPKEPGIRVPNIFPASVYCKYLAATPGDVVEVTSSVILVNGRAWPNSQPPNTPDPFHHRVLGRHVVPSGHVWVLGTNSDSFDSRYFGELRTSSIKYTLKPIRLFGISENELCNDKGPSPCPCFLRPNSVFSH